MNAHRNENLKQKYRESVHSCELYSLLCKTDIRISANAWLDNVPIKGLDLSGYALHVHHIWPGPGRPDVWSNFLVLSFPVHEWVGHTHEGRVASMYAKFLKGGDDWNPGELKFVLGCNPLGKLGNYQVGGIFAEWQDEMVNATDKPKIDGLWEHAN